MAAIILTTELNGKPVTYTLITTDRPNTDGYFGAKLFDDHLNAVGMSLSSAREDCLRQVKAQMDSRCIGNVMSLYGYNIASDVKKLLMHEPQL